MFVLIFTCLNIRAVHFELLPDMSTRNFVLAFQRFCNMYSLPQILYSDNAKTFIKEVVFLKILYKQGVSGRIGKVRYKTHQNSFIFCLG